MTSTPHGHAPGHQNGAAVTASEGLRASGERIERLLDASASAGPLARERAEELVRLVVDLYGAGIERILEIAYDAGVLSDEVVESLADDELVSSLLLAHGLHPYAIEDRIGRALEKVRPYLGSHGGDVEFIEVTAEGVARLRMLGSCDGCPSSAVTLSLAVEGAITGAAPEVTSIEVVETPASTATSSVIPVDALSVRLREPAAAQPVSSTASAPSTTWEPVTSIDDLPAGSVQSFVVGGQPMVLARLGADVYAYGDGCPACSADLGGASLERQLGGAATVILTCPGCRAHYDIRRAGAGLDGAEQHLEPLPLLQRDGIVDVAVAGNRASPVPA